MRNGDKDIEHMRDEYDSRRRFLVENLNRIGLNCFEPRGAFYVFPCIRSTGLTSEEFCERFLMEQKVAVDPRLCLWPRGRGLCAGLLRRLHAGSGGGGQPYGDLPGGAGPQAGPEGKLNFSSAVYVPGPCGAGNI